MRILIGVSDLPIEGGVSVAGACHYEEPPKVKLRGMPVPYLKRKLLGITVVMGRDHKSAINTLTHRIFEKLLLQDIEDEALLRTLTLLTRPRMKKYKFILPQEHPQSHWLVSIADRALEHWHKENDLWYT